MMPRDETHQAQVASESAVKEMAGWDCNRGRAHSPTITPSLGTSIEMPAAWMGFAPRIGDKKRACVKVCGWCPDKETADALAAERGYDVTHGQCPKCYQRITGERYGG